MIFLAPPSEKLDRASLQGPVPLPAEIGVGGILSFRNRNVAAMHRCNVAAYFALRVPYLARKDVQ